MTDSNHDYEQRRSKVMKEFGHEPPRVVSYNMAVKVFVRNKIMLYEKNRTDLGLIMPGAMEERESTLVLPEEVQENDAYISVVGMVISQGPECYPKDRCPSGPSCLIGDWINFRNCAGELKKYRGIWIRTMPDDACQMILEDPNHVTRT